MRLDQVLFFMLIMTDLTLICQDSFNIKHVKQSNVLCLKGDALEYIHDQTEEICLTVIH